MQKGHALVALAVAAALFVGVPHSAFAADTQGRSGIDGAAEALRNELSPMLLTKTFRRSAASQAASISATRASRDCKTSCTTEAPSNPPSR